MSKRIVTAVVLLAALALAMQLPNLYWMLFVAAIIGLMAWEMGRLLAVPAIAFAVSAVAFLLSFAFAVDLHQLRIHQLDRLTHGYLALVTVTWAVLIPYYVWRAAHRRQGLMRLLLAYWLLSAVFIATVLLKNESISVLLYPFILTWVSDTGAYFAGKKWGRRKLAPTISPNKTIEGSLAGVLSVLMIATLVAIMTLPETMPWHILVLSIVGYTACAYFAGVGDLHFSLLKRDAKVKDSSALLPGHGGVLDRLDSWVAVAPWALWLSVLTQWS